ncbi:hypothetical protein [Sphingopyxis sp.]|jgi:hypothetical protein|uniref:hypothetical protein n=1 Tax=Sphingopyxis sp. TaxID=1908224 RepID=UPI0025E19A3F|nr:hypothetical protein [Sphingopyxis sp.]MBK6412515.1 hypothetical protein [Sphingopyxis sp.]
MTRLMLPATLLLLAACSGGDDSRESEDKAAIAPPRTAERPASADTTVDADMAQAADAPPAKPGAETAADGNTIPTAIRGRWALDASDCPKRPGTDLTALVIDAANLRFHESHGELARVRESDAGRIVADYKFSGEGIEWDRRMQLGLADGGKTLVRRDEGEGAAAGPMRYTRCT